MANNQKVDRDAEIDKLLPCLRAELIKILEPHSKLIVEAGGKWPPQSDHRATLAQVDRPVSTSAAEADLLLETIDRVMSGRPGRPGDSHEAFLGAMTEALLPPVLGRKPTRKEALVHALVVWISEDRHEQQMYADANLGLQVRVKHPARMRRAKADRASKRRRQNLKDARSALAWARHRYPTAATDNKVSFLKRKAAERLGVHPSTLNRWLGYETS